MPRPKKTEDAAVEVKATAAAPAEEKKDAEKKTPAKKAAAPKAAAEERKVFIQNGMGGEIAGTKLIEKAKEVAGVKTAKSVDVYVRFDINRVYYVIDTTINGSFELF